MRRAAAHALKTFDIDHHLLVAQGPHEYVSDVVADCARLAVRHVRRAWLVARNAKKP